MIRNYIKVALRNMARKRIYTFINISGLAIGMAACLLIILFIRYELSFDKYHENADRIYRVSREWFNADGESNLHLGHVAPPFGPLIKNDFEGIVQESVRMLNDDPLMTYGDKQFQEEQFFFVDEGFFRIFSYEILDGDVSAALKEPNTLVLTKAAAYKYFGEEEAIGQVLNYNNMVDLKVVGIVEETPANSHFHFDMLCSFQTVENYFGRDNLMGNWGSNNYSTFLLLPEGYDPDLLASQFPDFLDKHMGEWNGIPVSKFNKLHLWPLTDIHLRSNLDSEIEANSDIATIYVFSLIALMILLIACINFINLSTAQSVGRAKEVGLRKVIGAHKSALVGQFLTESVILALFALCLGVLLVKLALPYFNELFDLQLTFNLSEGAFILFLLIGMALISGLVAGSYPAFYISSFKPVRILRGDPATKGKGSGGLRSALVVAQFAISICLMVCVGIVLNQLEYVKSKPLGFAKENVVVLPMSEDIYNNFENLKQRFLKQPGITDVSLSSRVPSGRLLDSQGGAAEVGGEMQTISVRVADIHVGHDYLSTLQVPFVAGRNFEKNLATDSSQAFVLNEAAVRAIGWSSAEEAIEKKFRYGGREGIITGVVQDFHFESLKQPLRPSYL